MASPEPVAVLTDVNAEHECLTALSATAQQLLKFRLYEDDEGVWVCCDWCNVWRYVAEHKDPAAFLKRTFHCKEVEKKCNVGVEEGSDQVFYETKYCAGSLVWAKRPDGRKEKDWLWWPALVEDSPDSVSQYFLLDESGHYPIAYHVTFLDAFRTCDWVESNLMKPFDPETKALNKPAASRAGKKQRFLKEAMERAKMAAKYSVVDRLDNFSYIAHMARLRGMIKSSKRPADKILNGTEQVLENLPKDSSRKGTLDSEHKKERTLRKRKLGTPENDVMSKKSASSEASDIVKTRATGQTRPQSIDESAVEAHDGITAQSDSKIDVDSGYAFDEESSLDKLFPTGRKRAAPGIKTTSENQSDSLNMSEFSSSLDEEESRLSGSITNRARKQNVVKSMNSKQVPPAGTKDLKASGKNVARGSPVSPADPIELSKTKTTKRRKSLPKDSVVESLPGDYASEAPPVAAGTALESVPDIAGSATAKFIQESGSGSSDGSLGFMPTITEEVSKHVALESDSNTLEPTSNLRVTKKRRPQRQNSLTNENESSEAVSFTQPSSKEKAATKKLGLAKRQNPAAQVKPSQSLSMSQPLPPRPRGKFAPPTRIKPKEGDYLLDDLHRDLDRGAF